jgi:hypothetical protein
LTPGARRRSVYGRRKAGPSVHPAAEALQEVFMMKRALLISVAALLVMAPVHALAQGASASDAQKKTMSATGTVSAVSAKSLTVKGKTDEWTFVVNDDTKVTGTGASRKTEELKADKKPSVITEFVKVGDSVVVRYHEADKDKVASEVRLQAPVKK